MQESSSDLTPSKKKPASNMSIASQGMRKNPRAREENIIKNIQQIFKDREAKMTDKINETIWDDKLRVYKNFRKEYESRLHELEKERSKVVKRKKNKKERNRALRRNTIEKIFLVSHIVKQTYLHYKVQYFESDSYRNMKLVEILSTTGQLHRAESLINSMTKEPSELAVARHESGKNLPRKSNVVLSDTSSREQDEMEPLASPKTTKVNFKSKRFIKQLEKFFDSPFKDDKKFAVRYMATLTRDRISECEEVVNSLFYDRVFNILLSSKDDNNRHYSFEILSNMVASDQQRHKLANNNYFRDVFEKMSKMADLKQNQDYRVIEKLSWLVTLISFHQDMFDHIIKLNLLEFILKISDSKFPSSIRSNAVLAISLLTYNEMLFDEIINKGVIDLIMALCRDQHQDLTVKQFSTLALVHFALSKKSINILIEKGVLELFDTFGQGDDETGNVNEVIQTNVSWIFLALCNNGITGKTMLIQGITRDMFLVSCNPDFQQIRHLVITGFAELGRCTDPQQQNEPLSDDKQRIKETSIVGMHKHLVKEAQKNIDILLNFSASDDIKFQHTAFWVLKDYIMLTHDNLIPDISHIIQAFMNGCLSDEENIQTECANAISFLVTHRLVYKSADEDGLSEEEHEKLLESIK